MAGYDPVTVDDFYERFPAAQYPQFTGADDLIEVLLAEASLEVDDSWVETDYKPAILYLTAHKFLMQTGDSADRGVITSEKFGPFSFTYGGISKATGEHYETAFGREFDKMMSRNFPGVLQV